ncbi:hypothetical protein B296_00008444 [Ensete ventricosum]|uniref:Uncharacterized protein n=1 Tax=Ensete ventricosum TaxID=4639 RepID=A0A426ZEQ3_ENSVE|nr:hypothetical protein B296_00008444 [Ensete ventricosum]
MVAAPGLIEEGAGCSCGGQRKGRQRWWRQAGNKRATSVDGTSRNDVTKVHRWFGPGNNSGGDGEGGVAVERLLRRAGEAEMAVLGNECWSRRSLLATLCNDKSLLATTKIDVADCERLLLAMTEVDGSTRSLLAVLCSSDACCG